MTLYEQFLHDIKDKTIAVIGIGVSNTPLIKTLAESGAKVTACDKKSREELGELYDELHALGVEFSLGETYLDNLSHDIVFRTPGLHPENAKLKEARANGSLMTSEMEVFFEVCPCKIIAITGSDGKTTTTTLVHEILKTAGFTCHLGGNIGNPLLCDTPKMEKDDIVILELSSFQLMTMTKSPTVSGITNITPNHLDMHTDMEEYIDAKKNVYLYQQKGDYCVLNADDPESLKLITPDGVNILNFSMEKPVINGAYLDSDDIMLSIGGHSIPVMKASDIKIPGKHNVANFLTALCLTAPFCKPAFVKEVAMNFGGVAHRIELVRQLNGVRYYNDSIASSPTRTIAGLNAFDKKVILIAGGYDKKIPYDVLGPHIVKNVKKLVLVGATAPKIKEAVLDTPDFDENSIEIYEIPDFKDAILKSSEIAIDGDVVLMSPASASFDLFKNFAHRGDVFKDIVNSL